MFHASLFASQKHLFLRALEAMKNRKKGSFESGIAQLDALLRDDAISQTASHGYIADDQITPDMIRQFDSLMALRTLPPEELGKALVILMIFGEHIRFVKKFVQHFVHGTGTRPYLNRPEFEISLTHIWNYVFDKYPARFDDSFYIAKLLISNSLALKDNELYARNNIENIEKAYTHNVYTYHKGIQINVDYRMSKRERAFMTWLCEILSMDPMHLPALRRQQEIFMNFHNDFMSLLETMSDQIREMLTGNRSYDFTLKTIEAIYASSPEERSRFVHDALKVKEFFSHVDPKTKKIISSYDAYSSIDTDIRFVSDRYYEMCKKKLAFTSAQAISVMSSLAHSKSSFFPGPPKRLQKAIVSALTGADRDKAIALIGNLPEDIYPDVREFLEGMRKSLQGRPAATRSLLEKAEEARLRLLEEMNAERTPKWIAVTPDTRQSLPPGAPIWQGRYDGQLSPYRDEIDEWVRAIHAASVAGADASFHVQALHALLARARSNLRKLQKQQESAFDGGGNLRTKMFRMLSGLADGAGGLSPRNFSPSRRKEIIHEEKMYLHRLEGLSRLLHFGGLLSLFGQMGTSASASRPSAKWMKKAREAVRGETAKSLTEFLTTASEYPQIVENDPDSTRPLIWAACFLPPEDVAPILEKMAKQCFEKDEIFGGIRDEKTGNACVWALENMPEGAGAPALIRLLAKVRYPKVKKRINMALNQAARAMSVTRADLDEKTAPDHGMASLRRRIPLNGGAAIMELEGGKLRLSWENDKGRITKTPPLSLKENDPDGIREARGLLKTIAKDLAAQKVRVENLYLLDRSWDHETWRERYAGHGTLALLARRLLWRAEWEDGRSAVILPQQDGAMDVTGAPVDCSGARIRLWHPLMSSGEEIRAWRERLLELNIIQPFRQAWRETYRLTEAELQTGTYSNRFAGHILRQHQTINLARVNGWEAVHRMWVDAPNDTPMRIHIPAHGLYAEFWVTGAGDPDEPPVTDSCAYIYLNTDRLKFCKLDEKAKWGRGADVALRDVPPIIFSEIMRHCDLFVSVASIGLDPHWEDRGRDALHPNEWDRHAMQYWQEQHEAKLNEVGRNRREVLSVLLPALNGEGRFTLEKQHLRVRGVLNEYLIHLSSAGVLKLPEKQHVCIVPKRNGGNKPLLPYEGDATLSLIISKALLLARDDKVRDPVIVSQIT